MLKSKEKLYKEILEKDRQIIEKNETIDRIYTKYLDMKDIVREQQEKIDKVISFIYILKNNVRDYETEYKEDFLNMLDDIGNILGGKNE